VALTVLLLDTSAYSAAKRGHPDAVAAVRRADRLILTPIVLAELHAGFLLGRNLRRNEAELETFVASSRVTVVEVDAETALRYAVIYQGLREAGTPIPTNDIWIAASAMQHGCAVLTADRHFAKVAQILVEILEGRGGR